MASSIPLPDSRRVSYQLDEAPAQGPIIILSNSLTAPFTAWDHVVASLNTQGFRTLRYDQPGHGHSSTPADLSSTTFESMADDVHHLLKVLEISKVHGWIGDSMGAAGGIYFITKFPSVVRKLVICDTISSSPINAGVDDVFGPRVASARQAGHMGDIIQGTLERWFGKPWLEANPDETIRMRSLMHGTSLDGFETCCAALRSKSFDLKPLFSKVGASIDDAICVVGEKDANLPQTMEHMRKEIQEGFRVAGKENKIELKIIKDAGHVPFIDGLDQFLDIVIPFLKS